jgi:large subunit ribosomal protein L21
MNLDSIRRFGQFRASINQKGQLMYAVIQTGGKQYRVQPGDIVQIEKLDGEVGASVKFDQVLFSSNANAQGDTETPKVQIGKPLLSGANVTGEIVGQGRDEKVTIVKMKRRKQYRRVQGHRQFQTQVLVTGVDNGAGDKATLSAQDKEARLTKFRTNLTPKGLAFTPKTLGSRKRLAASATTTTEASAPQAKAPAAKKTAAPKAAAKKSSK